MMDEEVHSPGKYVINNGISSGVLETACTGLWSQLFESIPNSMIQCHYVSKLKVVMMGVFIP